jgi:pantetheine-phosphate adenylyltransferase
MQKKEMAVLLPGSYDPPTKGHLSLIERAAEEYGRVFAVAFINPQKVYTFTAEEREEMLRRMTAHLPTVTVGYSEGLVIDYARANGIDLLIKGYRNETDLAYEKEQAAWNLKNGGIETLFYEAEDGLEAVSSTAVREALSEKNATEALLHEAVWQFIYDKRQEKP